MFRMAMKFYNTLTNEIEEFKEIEPGLVKMYSCGPTVYNYAHIGNLRSFTFTDVLRRYLKYKGYEIKHVMNITDVDDKTIKNAEIEKLPFKEFTEKYTKLFFSDLDQLNIEKPEHIPLATETIPEMVEIIRELVEKGIAYVTRDGVYFDIKKYEEYGKLSKINLDNLQKGTRVKKDEYDKNNVNDFALWKSWDETDRDVFWHTPFGKGRPGWHIECSAMSMKYLGESFDIHTGGIDLVFPHHENEIAQSESLTKKKFVNYWMHCAHLVVDGEKMSKSKGNFYVLKDILDKGFSARAVRYLLMQTHYRQQMNFTFEGLESAEKTVAKLQEFMLRLKNVSGEEKSGKKVITREMTERIHTVKENFENSLDEDLNMSGALGHLFDFISDINNLISNNNITKTDSLAIIDTMINFDKVLGVIQKEEIEVPEEIEKLVNEREIARNNEDWEKADEIRKIISDKGYSVDDTAHGNIIKKI